MWTEASQRAWLSVFGGFIIHLSLGTLYLWANITSAVTSYLKSYDSSITYDDTITIYASILAAQGSMMLLGGIMAQHHGTRRTCALGSTLIVVGHLLASFVTTLPALLVCHGIMMGLGSGLCYTAPISNAVNHLPARKGLVTGIIVGGFGCGAFVFGFYALSIVNPSHESVESSGEYENYFPPDSSVVANVPRLYRVLALTFAVMHLVGILCITEAEPITTSEVETPKSRSISLESPVSSRSLPLQRSDGSGGQVGKISHRTFLSKIRPSSSSSGWARYQSIEDCSGESSSSPANNPMIEMTSLHGPTEDSEQQGKSSASPYLPITNAEVELGLCEAQARDGHSSSPRNPSLPSPSPAIEATYREVMRSPIAYHIMSCFAMTTVGGMYIAGTFKTYGQSYFHDESYLMTISSLSSIFNFLGRVSWGAISDRFGALRTLLCMTTFFALILYTYSWSVQLGEPGFALYTFLIFFCEGGNFVLYVPITILLFGQKHSASNYGLIFTSYSLFVVLNICVLAKQHVSFQTATFSMGTLTLLGAANVFLLLLHIRCTRGEVRERIEGEGKSALVSTAR